MVVTVLDEDCHMGSPRWGECQVSSSDEVGSSTAQAEVHCAAPPRGATPIDSDDSDDIVVSPTRPLRSREKMLF